MSERVERVRAVLEAQLVEIEAEAAGLREALRSLDGGAPVQAPKRSRRRKARRAGSKRVARGERPKQLLAAVEANQAGSLARRLEAKGEIKRSKQGIRVAAKGGGK